MRMTILNDSIRLFLEHTGLASRAQLERFFAKRPDIGYLDPILNSLVRGKKIDYDATLSLYTADYRAMHLMSEREIQNRVKAVWCLTAYSERELFQFYALRYPLQLGFITANNTVYDITVLDSRAEAQLAYAKFSRLTPPMTDDLIRHIAVVPDGELGKITALYGFSSYCLLTEDNTPKFYNLVK